jgi:hypothetical protein
MTHDYKRNGTTTLFAALNVKTGEVIGKFSRLTTDKPENSIVSVQLLPDALTDPRISESVAERALICQLDGVHRRQTPIFRVADHEHRPSHPLALAAAKTIGAHEALVTLMCSQCFTVIEALQRDLGIRLELFVCEPPTGRH